ncbi:MAG TPA: carboxypeptidase regulatory-like domain-containing protein, partial [Acidimicrobiales bacterium]|nr:carboxypeptidase regulatory-like domain-containing protein [Acidimicrobiales bacterium]
MRALLANPEVSALPGQPFSLSIDISNTTELIDAVAVSVDGLPGSTVSTSPSELELFPNASGSVTVRVQLPKDFRAGKYSARVSASSRATPAEVASCEFSLDVEPVTRAAVTIKPLTRTGHRKSHFSIEVDNLGNTDLDVALDASDPERELRLSCAPARLVMGPGSSQYVRLGVRAPHKLFGSEKARQVRVGANAVPVRDGSTLPAIALEARATYVQKPQVARGVLTVLLLTAIVALWAGIMTFALTYVLSPAALAKSAPLSFFAPVNSSPATGGAAHSPPGVGAAGAAGAAGTPAGFQPKNVAPAGAGGTISGKVTSRFEPGGVARVTVVAMLVGAKHPTTFSAATGADGTFQIVGLFPGSYKVQFYAPGYNSVWYPGTASSGDASSVTVTAGATPAPLALSISGKRGSIAGQVVTGEAPAPPVTVTAYVGGEYAGTVKTNTDGKYALSNLPTPATYTLSFLGRGFNQFEEQVFVDGGQRVVANAVQLAAARGEIAGLVTSSGVPVPGVNVVATANGNTFTSATASSGAVGAFSLPQLPTPATYLLTFSAPGFGTRTEAIYLGPGAEERQLQVGLVGGTGTVSGSVTNRGGQGLGGVSVTVGGTVASASTQTLTGGGQVGYYTLAGLPTPGYYAFTFSKPGYASQTIGVKLKSDSGARSVNVTLAPTIGSLAGTVEDARTKAGLPGVSVSVTNGLDRQQTTTASSPDGGYQLTQLPG